MKTLEEIVKPYEKELEIVDYLKLKNDDLRLINKWRDRIPKGWYGFDGINTLWGKIIDEFLIELEKIAPNFEIHQIKLKFGGLRFYVDINVTDEKLDKKIHKEIRKLEELLFSQNLVY